MSWKASIYKAKDYWLDDWTMIPSRAKGFSLQSCTDSIEELLGRNSSRSDLENREYDHRDPLC
jgi:hypothetical protein